MPRWIAFDQQTSSLLRSNVAQDDRVETFGRGALDYALAKPGAVVTLLPAGGDGVALATFRRPRPARMEHSDVSPRREPTPGSASIRAGGFLGLSDESVLEDESQVETKKGWWRRFWDE